MPKQKPVHYETAHSPVKRLPFDLITTKRREPFLIAATQDLDENFVYANERRLVEEIKASLDRGRRVGLATIFGPFRQFNLAHPGALMF